jgi:hypothetical protein
MKSAFRTVVSAAGVGSACYLIAIATWDQVLMLFMLLCLGWCLFVWHCERRRNEYGPRYVAKRSRELLDGLVAPKACSEVWTSPRSPAEMLDILTASRATEPQSAMQAQQTSSNSYYYADADAPQRVSQPRTIYKFPIHQLAAAPQRLEPQES